MLYFLSILVIFLSFYAKFYLTQMQLDNSQILIENQNILYVLAHPDDESM